MVTRQFSFKGTNPLSAPENRRSLWKKQLNEIKIKIDKASDRQPRLAISLYEEYNCLMTSITDDDSLRKPSEMGSIVSPRAAPEWLRDEIKALDLKVEQTLNKTD